MGSPSLEAFGIFTKISTSPLEETMKLICLALFLALGLVSGKPGPFSQDTTEPETLKNDIVDPKESLEQIMEDVEDKVEVPESDENVVNDDLSDLDRWGCRDILDTRLCRIFILECNRTLHTKNFAGVCRKT